MHLPLKEDDEGAPKDGLENTLVKDAEPIGEEPGLPNKPVEKPSITEPPICAPKGVFALLVICPKTIVPFYYFTIHVQKQSPDLKLCKRKKSKYI